MRDRFAGIKAVLLDIEGTTTPMDFVHKTLFSFAREHVYDFLERNAADPQVENIVSGLNKSYNENREKGKRPAEWSNRDIHSRCKSASEYVSWLIGIDSKDTAMKELQGLIWADGYKSHELHGEVYADVPTAMQKLHSEGIVMAIYSSGSSLAQKLIFGTTAHGDLTKYLSGFFDTGVGNKRDPESYSNISRLMGFQPSQILFLSDILEEINAARSSGLMAIQVVREGHNTAKDQDIPVISDLLEIL